MLRREGQATESGVRQRLRPLRVSYMQRDTSRILVPRRMPDGVDRRPVRTEYVLATENEIQ